MELFARRLGCTNWSGLNVVVGGGGTSNATKCNRLVMLLRRRGGASLKIAYAVLVGERVDVLGRAEGYQFGPARWQKYNRAEIQVTMNHAFVVKENQSLQKILSDAQNHR